jgi:hypothetical protein
VHQHRAFALYCRAAEMGAMHVDITTEWLSSQAGNESTKVVAGTITLHFTSSELFSRCQSLSIPVLKDINHQSSSS